MKKNIKLWIYQKLNCVIVWGAFNGFDLELSGFNSVEFNGNSNGLSWIQWKIALNCIILKDIYKYNLWKQKKWFSNFIEH